MPLNVSSVDIPKFKKKLKYIQKACTIMTNRFKNGQKRGPLKRSDIFRNLTVPFNISLFMLQLKFPDAYKRIFKSFSLE